MLSTIIIFLLILSLLVFVHELGHFLTARKFGIRVDEFGFGLPPRVFGFQKMPGENGGKSRWRIVSPKYQPKENEPMVWSLNWILIGGFVKIKGENGESANDPNSFGHKKIWQRILVIVAGVVMNVVLCMVLLSIGFMIGLPVSLDMAKKGVIISEPKIQIVNVLEGRPAQVSGLKPGDEIISIDDKKIVALEEVKSALDGKGGKTVNIKIKRAGQELDKQVNLGGEVNNPSLGVALTDSAIARFPWYLAIWYGIKMTFVWLATILSVLWSLIVALFTGKSMGMSAEISGPIGIAALTGQATKMGFTYLLQFAALLSLNLAIINILPFPALDGGRVVFLIAEKLRGKAVKQQWENMAHNIGFLLLMLLIVIVTFRDLMKYGGRILGALKSLIGL